MVKSDKVRLNHELLVWCGFTLTNGVWSYPDGVTVDDGVPYFPESLDDCFEWLTPMVKYTSLCYPEHKSYNDMWLCEVRSKDIYGISGHAEATTPALALCLAIQKVIEQVVDNNKE